MNEPMVSVVIPTYNHEKYITKAIDSVLEQQTEYTFEILVGEDKSTDQTRKVLEQYEMEHPHRITVFYRDHNLSNDVLENAPDLRRKAKGKYVITLEGDDFWISKNKIQKQVDFLEANKDYIAVAHNCVVVDENSNLTDEIYPYCKDVEYTLSHYLKGVYPGQLATVMYRNFNKEKYFDETILERHLSPGDKLLYFALVTNGKVRCIQDNLSAYRHIKKTGSSYSATYKYNFKCDENWYFNLLDFANKQNKGIKVAEALYLGCLFHGMKEKQINGRQFFMYMKNIKYKFSAICLFISRMISIHLLHDGKAN